MLGRRLFKTKSGQSVVEYLAFFAAIGAITLLSVCSFYPRLHQACQDMFQEAIELPYMHSTEQ